MYQFYTASKDATIYKHLPTRNTGRDEILELSKEVVGDTTEVSRFLIQFDTNTISAAIASGAVTMSSAELLFKECESAEVPTSYVVEGYPLSASWDNGIGWKYDNISTDGVSWIKRTTAVSWSIEGGDLITSSFTSQTVEYLGYDLTFDVSASLSNWISGLYPNNGFIFRLSGSAETDGVDYGRLQFFSKETNTIYQPKIRIGWNDQSFDTGSLPELTEDDIYVTVRNLRPIYKVGSNPTIRVFGRARYPLKTYTDQYQYNNISYLPETSYYQVRDVVTDEIIIPFSNYSKISCDANGNYFTLNLSNWETNREYYIEFKIDINGSIQYFTDRDLVFRVDV